MEITEVKKHFARARLLRVEAASPERVTPECRYFGQCGGCQYQHLAYPAQLRVKQKQIADLFERVGKISRAVIAPVLPCPAPYGYRNRIMIRSQWNGPAKKLVIGFVRADNQFVEDIEECQIAEPALNEQIKQVRANPPPKGGLKVVLRVQPEGWEVPRHSFFQNNFFLLPELVETVRGFLQAGGARHLIDLYCGVGFFGIEAADVMDSFTGVEYDQPAIAAARKNAAVAPGDKRRVHRRQGGSRAAGTAEKVPGGADGGAAGPAAQRLLARTAGTAAPDAAGPGHLCFLPPGDDGSGFEHFMRRRCL